MAKDRRLLRDKNCLSGVLFHCCNVRMTISHHTSPPHVTGNLIFNLINSNFRTVFPPFCILTALSFN